MNSRRKVNLFLENLITANQDQEKIKNKTLEISMDNDIGIKEIDPAVVTLFRYALVTLIDVERSFSLF